MPIPALANPAEEHVGDAFELRLRHHHEYEIGEGSRGSSNGNDFLLERIISASEAGIEFEYDLVGDASGEDRERQWQLPVRVLKPGNGGALQILNTDELELRVDRWLADAEWTREVCGEWIFTWNAFQIDCDIDAVPTSLERYDLWYAELRDGALFYDREALHPAALEAGPAETGGMFYRASFTLDAELVRQGRVESDLAAARILGEELSEEQAKADHASENISGTLELVIETDVTGMVLNQSRKSNMQIVLPDGSIERHASEETIERIAVLP